MALRFVSLPVYIELSIFLGDFACYAYGPVLRNFVLIGGICSGSSFIAIKKTISLGSSGCLIISHIQEIKTLKPEIQQVLVN